MKETVYIKFKELTELTCREVLLKDVAQVYCRDAAKMNRCKAMKIMHIQMAQKYRYVMSALDVVAMVEEQNPALDVQAMGAEDFVIAYKPPSPPMLFWQWMKTLFVCGVCFFGAAFAIMTFNNDVSAADVFQKVHLRSMGTESDGFSVLEVSYCIGLALGIVVFFNHVAAKKLNTDPTPLEVEMRLYEDNISKTLIANADRKESKIDTA